MLFWKGNMRVFHLILSNSLFASVLNAFAWFSITYRVFLQTHSIIATSFIAGIFAVSNMCSAAFFGNVVDHTKKHVVMQRSTLASLLLYAAAAGVYFSMPTAAMHDAWSPWLRCLILLMMFWSVTGNLRNIALSTTVSLLLPEEEHAKANGKIGMVNGVAFALTSVASGLMIGFLGMWWSLVALVAGMSLVLVHLSFLTIPEQLEVHDEEKPQRFSLKETIATVSTIPGLFALIFFTTFNNFLWGVFMALMDAYGLMLVSVQTWWILRGILSFSFIGSGIRIAKFGLWTKPLKSFFLINMVTWTTCMLFPIQSSIVLLAIGMCIWMICAPFIEATESTLIQKVVPYEKQGRVFGFAQSVESAASPITTLLIWPLTQLIFIPLMTTGRGARLLGDWFGTGADRGIALVFICAGLLGLCITVVAFYSKRYIILVNEYEKPTKENEVA